MKEFVEKLIGRLEECEKAPNVESPYNNGWKTACQVMKNAVNQLAEEYKHCTLCYLQSPCEYQNENAMLPNELLADKNGWIPCSERLPEVNGWYLVTNELGVVQQQHWGASHWQKLRDDAVIAWQPLPTPYQPKGE